MEMSSISGDGNLQPIQLEFCNQFYWESATNVMHRKSGSSEMQSDIG